MRIVLLKPLFIMQVTITSYHKTDLFILKGYIHNMYICTLTYLLSTVMFVVDGVISNAT